MSPVAPPADTAVDLTLIADRLRLTPEQRVRENEALVRVLVELRRSAGVHDDRFDDPPE